MSRSAYPRQRGELPDDGFATVWVGASMALVAAAASVAMLWGVAVLERHRAALAADAVSLQVALKAVEGRQSACAAGAALGRRDGAALTACDLDGAVALVSVHVRLPGLLSRFGSATGQARAGPVGMSDP
jgi:secretion/DNA translocation related TadE-like protein